MGHADLTGPYLTNHIKPRYNGNTKAKLHDGTNSGKRQSAVKFKFNPKLNLWQVIVKYDEEVPVKFNPPMPTDSVADTMYFINMMREEGEEARRKARDELILRMAMEQKSRQREVSKSHYLRL